MLHKIRKKITGKKKLAAILVAPVIAILAWPFVIPSLLGYLVHKKVGSPKWKYGIITCLSLLGLSSAPTYYAGLTTNFTANSNTNQVSLLQGEIHGALVPTVAPTLIPTATPTPTLTLVQALIPTKKYILPRNVYMPPTQSPTTQSNSQLDNNHYYINSVGNSVHSPANSVDGSVPAGASARCGDGTFSFSQSSRGTCSHHGGVAQWL